MRALSHWSHYLKSKVFVLHFDHQGPKFLNGQPKRNARYAKWVEFLKAFTFSTKHKKGIENMAGALWRSYALISILGAKFLVLQAVQSYYPKDPVFQDLIENTPAQGPYLVQERFLFKGNKLCVPVSI